MMEVLPISPMITLFFTNRSFMFKALQCLEEEKQGSLSINNNKYKLTLKKHWEVRTLLHQIVIGHRLIEITTISHCTLICFLQGLTCTTTQISKQSAKTSLQARISTISLARAS